MKNLKKKLEVRFELSVKKSDGYTFYFTESNLMNYTISVFCSSLE